MSRSLNTIFAYRQKVSQLGEQNFRCETIRCQVLKSTNGSWRHLIVNVNIYKCHFNFFIFAKVLHVRTSVTERDTQTHTHTQTHTPTQTNIETDKHYRPLNDKCQFINMINVNSSQNLHTFISIVIITIKCAVATTTCTSVQ